LRKSLPNNLLIGTIFIKSPSRDIIEIAKNPYLTRRDKMPTFNMEGPYALTKETVDALIEPSKIGNYALCHKNANGKFHVRYVGKVYGPESAAQTAYRGIFRLPPFQVFRSQRRN
jgi:hypothetical protein